MTSCEAPFEHRLCGTKSGLMAAESGGRISAREAERFSAVGAQSEFADERHRNILWDGRGPG
jgi:hypothetical protein